MNKKTAEAVKVVRQELLNNPMAAYAFLSLCRDVMSLRAIERKYPAVSYDSVVRKAKEDFDGTRDLNDMRLYKKAHTLQPYAMEVIDNLVIALEKTDKFKTNEANLRNSLAQEVNSFG